MKKTNEYIILCLFIIMFSKSVRCEQTFNIPLGSCLTFTGWNSTSNAPYNFMVCSNVTNIPTLNITNETCLINTTAYSIIQVFNATNQTCDLDIEVLPEQIYRINQTTHPACNVTIKSPKYYCPGCPNIDFYYFNDTIEPKVGNITRYQKSKGTCSIDLIINACPWFSVNIPQGYAMIEDVHFQVLQENSRRGIECCSDLSFEREKRFELETKYCPLNPNKLLEGYRGLSGYEKTYLETFAYINNPIDYSDFAQLIAPHATESYRQNIEYYASIALKEYAEKGFAEKICSTYYSEKYMENVTYCQYIPKIKPVCLNITKELYGIRSKGVKAGVYWAIGIIILILLIAFGVFVLIMRAPFIPFR